MEEQKKKDLEEAKKKREERKRMLNELRNQERAEEVAEQDGDDDVEDNVEEVLEENADLIDNLVEDLMGIDPGLDDIVIGLPTRSGRIPKPSARLRDLYEQLVSDRQSAQFQKARQLIQNNMDACRYIAHEMTAFSKFVL